MNILIIGIIFIILVIIFSLNKNNFTNPCITNAICVLTNTTENINGHIDINDTGNGSIININARGFTPNTKHGFHIHNKGNLVDGCESLCSHFNPTNSNHGDLNSEDSHVGDLGNLTSDSQGNVKTSIFANRVTLNGDWSVLGRSFIIHKDEDDLGLYNGIDNKKREESLKTGNAGKRIACGVIGIA